MLNRIKYFFARRCDNKKWTNSVIAVVVIFFQLFSGCSRPQIDNIPIYSQFNEIMDSCYECYLDDFDKALYLSTKAIKVADSIEYVSGLALAYRMQSIAFIKLGNSEESINSLSEAFKNAELSGNSELLGKCYQTKGYIKIEMGDLLAGLDATRQSLKYYEDVKNDRKIVEVYCNIGNTYFLDGDYKNAIKYLKKALLFSKKCDFVEGASAVLLNLGAAYEKEGEYEKAIYSFEMSLNLDLNSGNKEQVIINYMNLFMANLDIGNVDKLKYYIEKADSVNTIFCSDIFEMRILRLYCHYFLEINEPENALEYLDSAFVLYKKLESPTNNVEFDEFYSRVYFKLGDYDKAYNSLLNYSKKADSISSKKGEGRIANLEKKREFEQKSLKAGRERDLALGVGVLLIIVLLSFLLFFINRMRLRNRIAGLEEDKSRVELEKKQIELVSREIHLSEKKALLNRLLVELVEIKNDENSHDKIGDIISMLRAESNVNNWEDFDIRFKELHSDFYEKLEMQFPNLSSYDRRLCAYLRMNLTTKEIAAITHQNPLSINTARTRLRKKLNLTQTNTNLNDFMSQI